MVSARRGRHRRRRRRASGAGSTASDLRLCRSILRRWPKAAAVTCSSARRSHGSGAARGTSRTTDEVTLGGGTKAAGETSNRILVSARQFGEHRRAGHRPRRPALATMRSATSRWNISTMMSYQGGHGSVVSQPTSSGGRDVVGQVGDDPGPLAAEHRARIEMLRVGVHGLEPAAPKPQNPLFRNNINIEIIEVPYNNIN